MDSEVPQLPQSEQRSLLIKEIKKRDADVFLHWVEEHEGQSRLDMPSEALRFLIPHRILELSQNPEAVTLRIRLQDKQRASFFIVEERDQGDFDHWISRDDLMEEGVLHQNDYIFAKVDLESIKGEPSADLHVKSYDDRRDLTQQGVGTSFGSSLIHFATELGYANVTGQNNERNVSFFLQQGGTRLTSLSKMDQEEFYNRYGERIFEPEFFTIMRLNSEE